MTELGEIEVSGLSKIQMSELSETRVSGLSKISQQIPYSLKNSSRIGSL
jgi:hypothetical protein